MRKRKFRIRGICLCLGLLLFLAGTAQAAAGSISDAQREKEELKGQLADVQALIDELRTSKEDMEEKITLLDGQLTEISGRIDQLNEQLAQKETQIADTEQELIKAQKEERKQYERMRKRIRYMYEKQETSYLEALLEAENAADFLNRAEYLEQIARYDREMLKQYQDTVTLVANMEDTLKKEQEDLALLASKVQEEQTAVTLLLKEKEYQLAEVGEEISQAQQTAQLYEAEMQAQDEMIAMIQAEEARRQEAKKKAEQEAKQKAEAQAQKEREEAAREQESLGGVGGDENGAASDRDGGAEGAGTVKEEPGAAGDASAVQKPWASDADNNVAKPENTDTVGGTKEPGESESKEPAESEKPDAAGETTEPGAADPNGDETEDGKEEGNPSEPTEPEYGGGGFVWPCPSSSRVTSDYGPRTAPTGGASSYHRGLDIGASYGADIVAAADGVVAFAGYSNASGNYLTISHGNGIYSVYMHCSSLVASSGQRVSAGQVVAKVGSTGISTGNHLHFGVSVNGSYVNPWDYLK